MAFQFHFTGDRWYRFCYLLPHPFFKTATRRLAELLRMGLENEPWWPDLVSQKDQKSLRELAAEFGTTPGAISLALKKTNTSRVPQGESLPPEVGEPRPGSKDNRIEPFRELLGEVPDSEVAKKAGVSVRTIASFRSRNQISGYKGRSAPKKQRKRRKSKIDPFADLVGKVPDRVVAEKAGVTLNAVRNYRASRGIPSSRQRAKELREAAASLGPSAQPVSADVQRPAMVGEAGYAWRVRFAAGVEGVVTGTTAVDAARAAMASGNGDVTGLDRLGSLL
jgi:transposase